ncbi:uncharacterized protein LOC128160971 [Crassostrea angulata]|uniref:uncharacterized protein LOC128160971 n=1 Tax=Magallana angulata TaxID=2784310 RepID=UPI0022B08D75|nr:uncharacterized protein LOC128160971 [Crassostrea angulata]
MKNKANLHPLELKKVRQHSAKKKCAERKPSFLISSSSNECKTTSTSEEIDDSTDTSYSDKRLRDGREGVYLATQWQYVDLKSINIFYNEKPDPIKELMQDVKTGILKNYPNFPNFENIVAKFSSFTEECLLFSCDFDKIVDRIKDQVDRITSRQVGQDALEDDIIEDIRSDIERAERVDTDLDLTDWLNRKWFPGVKVPHYTLKKFLISAENYLIMIESMMDKKYICQIGEKMCRLMVYVVVVFFYFRRTVGKTIEVGDQLMTSTPDFAYPLASVQQAGRTLEDCRLLFIVEVKGTPINNVSSECLEEQLDSYVLGQVGSELFAQANTSAMCPNSLGMICMETKLIFVYLKMPKEHRNLTFPLRTEGKIHYTRPFDMMKAEDRAEVCEFLYWLGCVQNRYGSKLFG